ncbi:MAG: hypothetical protein R3C68_19660 [Myxococcota bacterium]
MATQKATIALPEELLIAVDKAAQECGSSRSGFISMILRKALRAKQDAAIARQLDDLFAKAEVGADQLKSTALLDEIGADWSEENWA